MIPLEIKALLARFHLGRWKFSRNGSHGLPCASGSLSFHFPDAVAVEYEWEEGGAPHHLQAARHGTESACAGTYDGVAFTGQLHLKTHATVPPRLEVSVVAEGLDRLRFDGSLELK